MAEQPKPAEGIEKAVASAVMSVITLASILGFTEVDPTSMEGVAIAIATLASPVLVWLTANSKKEPTE